MKSILELTAATGFLAAVATAQTLPHYAVTDLGSVPGGTFSQANFVSDAGFVAGLSTINSSATSPQHAVLWYDRGLYSGLIFDIGAPGLGGPNSSAWGINALGQVVVEAETSTKDPNNENYCVFGTGLTCVPALWQNGIMTALPLLGGNNGSIGNINSRGEVSGIAENGVRDPACASAPSFSGNGPQFLDFEPVIWGPKPGQIRQLPLPHGDTVGMALLMNDNGQAVGATGTCANTSLPGLAYGPHAVLWDKDGSVTDLGNLGAAVLNVGLSINNRGQVVGISSLTADATPANGHDAFLWSKQTGMQDLGKLPGDVASAGLAINDSGTVVGISQDAVGDLRAFVWQNGVMTDLNTLVAASSPLYLLFADSINANGEIAGFGVTGAGDVHAFLLTPHSANASDASSSSAELGALKPISA